MSDDRSERLRKRRKQSTAGAQRTRGATDRSLQQSESESESEPESEPAEDSHDESTGGHDTVSIKEEQTGTYMYLPESQTKEMRRLYNILKAEYEFEYDEEFEKNRHFYPLVIQYGLEGLDGLDASGIREHLREIS